MPPFFILGNPRSGTTLLRLMLNNHPKLVVPPECGFIQWWSSKYGNWNINEKEKRINSFLEDLKNSKKIETWNLDYKKLRDKIILTSPTSYAELCELVYISYAEKNNKNSIISWGDKNNYYIDYLHLINNHFPDAKFIHIIRDGRDVACSYLDLNKLSNDLIYKPNLSNDLADIAIEWKSNNNKILNFFKHINNEYYFSIKFEDLVLNSKSTLNNLSSFLNIPFNKEMLNYHSDNRKNIIEPKETLAWKKKTLEKPDNSVIGRYKKQLSENEVNKFESIASDLLNKFGYMSDG